ncbi:MAG: hypothetical protein SGJ13_17065 [Actinomycetota bacterium]|nr:hypothetical protein [Actinomycetota bacterium]
MTSTELTEAAGAWVGAHVDGPDRTVGLVACDRGETVHVSVRDGWITLADGADGDIDPELVIEGGAVAMHGLLSGRGRLAELTTVRARTRSGALFALPPGDIFVHLPAVDAPVIADADVVVNARMLDTPLGDRDYFVVFSEGRPRVWGEGVFADADLEAELPYEGHLLWAAGRCSILEAYWGPGGSLSGDLPELMVAGGLYTRPEFTAGMCRLPEDAFEPLCRFRDLARAGREQT